MPNSSRQKGDRAERQIVELFRSLGFDAYRVPLSGAAAGFKSDVEVRIGPRTLRLESKVKAGKFGLLYRWLNGSDILCVKADRKPMLAVLDLEKLASLLTHMPSATQTIAQQIPENLTPNYPTIKVSPPTISVDPKHHLP
jgi:hypothetical protein